MPRPAEKIRAMIPNKTMNLGANRLCPIPAGIMAFSLAETYAKRNVKLKRMDKAKGDLMAAFCHVAMF